MQVVRVAHCVCIYTALVTTINLNKLEIEKFDRFAYFRIFIIELIVKSQTHGIFRIGSVHEVEEERSSSMLLLNVVKHRLTKVGPHVCPGQATSYNQHISHLSNNKIKGYIRDRTNCMKVASGTLAVH